MDKFSSFFCLCLIFCITFTGHAVKGQSDSSVARQLGERGLVLPRKDILQIEKQPDYLKTRRMVLLSGYPDVVEALAGERTRLSERFLRAEGSERVKVENDALIFIEESFRFFLFPFWAGGKWSLGGRAQGPQNGPMACGYFLERIMKDLGFNIRPIKGYTMGQLATDEMMWSFNERYQENLRDWNGLEAYLKSEGPGLYLVGISSRWGHVLFLRYPKKGPTLLYHSGPGIHGLKVQVDPAEEYIRDLMKPHVIHAAKIDRKMARKWLTGAPIRPVKCKAFGTKSARKGSNVAQVQSDLKRLGFYHGPIDGNFGPGTRTAIGLFQKACGMQPTLLPDGQTLKKLNAAAARADARSASATLKKEAHYPFNGKGPDETICFVRYARNVILSSDRGSHALHNYSPGTFEEKAAIRHFLTTEGSRRHWHRPFLLPVWPG